MKQYSSQIREAALRRILPPNSEPITSVARDMGISAQTLINWRKSAASETPLELDSTKDSGQFSSEDKFDIVLATASMNETELGEYARNKGVFVEQIAMWRSVCQKANANFGDVCKRFSAQLKEKDEQIQQLKQDLNKKNTTIAEMAAEIVLRKKCLAIWGEEKAE